MHVLFRRWLLFFSYIFTKRNENFEIKQNPRKHTHTKRKNQIGPDSIRTTHKHNLNLTIKEPLKNTKYGTRICIRKLTSRQQEKKQLIFFVQKL